MKYLSIISLLLLSTNILASNQYGGKITLKNAISLSKATSNFKKNKNQEILISAKVGKVCQAKGCWMSLEDEKGDIRVTFKDYSFFVPMSLIGKNVLVQGSLQAHTMTVKEAKHLAQDAGEDPKKITSPITEYRIIASAVLVK